MARLTLWYGIWSGTGETVSGGSDGDGVHTSVIRPVRQLVLLLLVERVLRRGRVVVHRVVHAG